MGIFTHKKAKLDPWYCSSVDLVSGEMSDHVMMAKGDIEGGEFLTASILVMSGDSGTLYVRATSKKEAIELIRGRLSDYMSTHQQARSVKAA